MRTLKGVVDLAKSIAIKVHKGQFRHDGKTPFITHPEDVANRLDGPILKAVAWLHDVIEDTYETTFSLLDQGVPLNIVLLVDVLTQKRGEKYFNYIEVVSQFSDARIVKLADIASNLADDPKPSMVKWYGKAIIMLEESL